LFQIKNTSGGLNKLQFFVSSIDGRNTNRKISLQDDFTGILDLSGNAPGVYLVQMKSADGNTQQIEKIVLTN
jgi:hypothetical protein